MTSRLNAVVEAATRGWPAFPVAAGGKVPAIPKAAGGKGLHDATCDTGRLQRWWAQHPDHNIGLATGHAFDVLDIDDQAADGALHGLWEAAGGPPGFLSNAGEAGPVVRTRSGGLHLYVAPTGIGNRARFIPGADWRGRGGYVVAPPSHHADGGAWEWARGHGPDRPLATAPEWLLAVLRSPAPVPSASHAVAPTDAYARRALEGEAGRVLLAPAGQRNNELNKAARSLGQLVATGALQAAVVVGHLYEAGTRAGLSAREVEATITSGLTAGMRSPRRRP